MVPGSGRSIWFWRATTVVALVWAVRGEVSSREVRRPAAAAASGARGPGAASGTPGAAPAWLRWAAAGAPTMRSPLCQALALMKGDEAALRELARVAAHRPGAAACGDGAGAIPAWMPSEPRRGLALGLLADAEERGDRLLVLRLAPARVRGAVRHRPGTAGRGRAPGPG
jgi:hypothetical protein